MSDNFSFKYTFGADDSGFQNVLSRVSGSLDGWGISLDTIYGKSTSLFKSFGVDIDKFAGKIGTTGPALAAGVGLAVAGFQALSKIVAETTEAWRSDEIALVKFNTAIEASGEMGEGASERLKDYARELSYMSGEAQAATQTQIAMLVATGRTEEEVVKITQAAMGLANATGVSVQTAMEQLNATFSGTAGRLTKTTPELLSLTKAELANGEAVDIMLEKYGAFSDSLSGTTDVSIKRHENAISDLKSVMGSWFEMGIKPIRDGLTKMIEYLVEHQEIVYGILNGVALGLSAILFAFNPILGAIALVGSALLVLQQYTGGWKGLWLETQKVALIVVDAIFDAISDLTNGFVFLINGILKGYNAVVGVLGVKPIKLLDPVDISDAIGITAALANVEAQIKANKDENAKLKKQSEETTAAQVEGAERVALNVGKYAADAAEAEIGSLEAQKEAALRYAEERGDSAAMMAYTSKIYDDQILENYKKRIESERQEAIENLAAEEISEENIANINKRYDLEIQAFEQEVLNEREELYADFKKKETEAGEKALEEEKKKAEEAAKAEKEKNDKIRELAIGTYENQIALLEQEKDKVSEASAENRVTAEAYSALLQGYDDEILASFLARIELEKEKALQDAEEKGLIGEELVAVTKGFDDEITLFKEEQLAARLEAEKTYSDELEAEAAKRAEFEKSWAQKATASSTAFAERTMTDEALLASTLSRIEAEEAAELEKAATLGASEETLANIHTYYQNQMTQETEDAATAQIAAGKTLADAWSNTFADMKKKAESWNSTMSTITNTIQSAFLKSMNKLGEALVNGEDAWASMGQVALEALASILDSIAAQLTGLAVVHALSLDFVGAGLAVAGAAAAAIAAGAIRAWSSSLSAAETGTEYSNAGEYLVGEQGPEIVELPQGARVHDAQATRQGASVGSKVVNFAPVFNSPREINQYEAMKAATAEARRLAAEGVF